MNTPASTMPVLTTPAPATSSLTTPGTPLPGMKPLSATARLQFHKGFTMDDAAALVPYFDSLGISHLYASPLLQARKGSTHGYDIVDHNSINPELGGRPALERMVATLRAHGMGLILDIVPNHMGVGTGENDWWQDVLEWGRASPYADTFDIDWDPPDPTLRGRMLAPFLGSAYGEALEAGELTLNLDEDAGKLYVDYFGNRFPVSPRDYAAVLLTEGGQLEEVARAFADLPTASRAETREAAAALHETLRLPENVRATREALRGYDAKDPAGRERLHRLLERQNYRLAWWRAASDEINWRRFFDVNGLAGIRAELAPVFDATHETVFALYAEGLIDGLRIDHVDGLAAPREYCRKLRRRLDALTAQRPATLSHAEPVIWIEKILATHERLATDWLTDGTTGYDFMNDVSAVLHDPAGETPLTELWSAQTGRTGHFEEEARAARRQILRDSLASELYATAVALHRIARRDLKTRDYTVTAIQRVLAEILVHFRVYRVYAGPGGLSETDRQAMDWAIAGARRTVPATGTRLLDLVAGWLSGEDLRAVPAGNRRNERLRAMVRFQQLSSPTAAKSVEDTAFYRYGRLISRNEVGSEPSQFSLTPAAFHAINKERQKRFPRALLATATHDHKRGEDNRIRLAVLSEIPGEWEAAIGRWTRLNASLKRDLDDGPAPDACDELMIYQTLVGAWPLDLDPQDADGLAALQKRVEGWLEKALREGKRRSGWSVPNEAYEQACRDFLAGVLDPGRAAHVGAEIAALVARIAPAGALNGLAQAVLRMTAPGIPDLYQGAEYWDLSLVDPDNRRPVDFPAREASLAACLAPDTPPPDSLMPAWHDGRVKQAVIARVLALRARAPELFTAGAYVPLRVEGPLAEHVLAFARTGEESAAIVAVSRLAVAAGVGDTPLVAPERWQGTAILLPRSLAERGARNVLIGRAGDATQGGMAAAGRLAASALFATLPVAVLEV